MLTVHNLGMFQMLEAHYQEVTSGKCDVFLSPQSVVSLIHRFKL